MIETLTDRERRRLVSLAIAAVPATHGDPELTSIIAKLSGVDTVVRVERAYPSARRACPYSGYECSTDCADLAACQQRKDAARVNPLYIT